MDRFTSLARRITEATAFEAAIIAIIIINAILLGLDTSPTVDRDYGDWIRIAYLFALAIFIVEALLKMTASSPRAVGYFRDGWNVFDFLVIVFALIPATGELAIVVRLARLLRVLRLVSTIKDLRLIVTALIRSIPSVGHVMMLMSIIVYIYAIIGFHLFSEHDPRTGATSESPSSPFSTSSPWKAGTRSCSPPWNCIRWRGSTSSPSW